MIIIETYGKLKSKEIIVTKTNTYQIVKRTQDGNIQYFIQKLTRVCESYFFDDVYAFGFASSKEAKDYLKFALDSKNRIKEEVIDQFEA